MDRSLTSINQEIEKTKQHLYNLENEKSNELSKTCIKCFKCKEESRIDKLTYIQPYFYVEAYGCTDGAYWKMSKEGRFQCLNCEHENRDLGYEKNERYPSFRHLKKYFGNITNLYRR